MQTKLPCHSKRKYKTEGDAAVSASRAMHNGRASYLRVYRCPHCGNYHLTKQRAIAGMPHGQPQA